MSLPHSLIPVLSSDLPAGYAYVTFNGERVFYNGAQLIIRIA